MRFSIIIAAHNEGGTLCRTVESSVQSIAAAEADYELMVADDASWDGSVEETVRRFPRVRVVRHEERRGASPTKHLGAQNAWGKVLVFLDGHCQPQGNALLRLVEDVEYLKGEAVVTPAVPSLDAQSWENSAWQVGHGYRLSLETFDCGWLPLDELKPWRRGPRKFYESPALIGCALALSRELYDELRGFDPDMLFWGVEDLDLGLKCWTMGHPILHDPEAVVGHRFRAAFDNYEVPFEHLLVNQLRIARKNFTYSVWCDWVERCRRRHAGRLGEHPEGLWAHAWQLFQQRLASADAERAHVQGRRVRDEFWYAERFGLAWPRIGSQQLSEGLVPLEADGAAPSPSPSPCPEATKDTVIPVYFVKKLARTNDDKPRLNVSIKIDLKTRLLSVKVEKGGGWDDEDSRYTFNGTMTGTRDANQFWDTDSAQFAVQWRNGSAEVAHFCNAGWLNRAYQGARARAAKWDGHGTGTSEYVSLDLPPYPENADHVTVVLVYTDYLDDTPAQFEQLGSDAAHQHGNGEGDMPGIIGYWTGCRDAKGWHLRKEVDKVLCYKPEQQKRIYPTAAQIEKTVDDTTKRLAEIGYTLVSRPTSLAFNDAVSALMKAYETLPYGDVGDTPRDKIKEAIKAAATSTPPQINPPPPHHERSHDTGFDIKPKSGDPGYPAT